MAKGGKIAAAGKSLERVLEKKRALDSAMREIRSHEYMKQIGQMAADMIRLRTRLGHGVEKEGADRQKLKPLKPKTVKDRDRARAIGELSTLTNPKKSNLTRTGQLLDSLTVKSTTPSRAVVGPSGTRDDGLTNAKVAEYVSEAGRPFNSLSKVEIKRMKDRIARDVRKAVRSHLTKKAK